MKAVQKRLVFLLASGQGSRVYILHDVDAFLKGHRTRVLTSDLDILKRFLQFLPRSLACDEFVLLRTENPLQSQHTNCCYRGEINDDCWPFPQEGQHDLRLTRIAFGTFNRQSFSLGYVLQSNIRIVAEFGPIEMER